MEEDRISELPDAILVKILWSIDIDEAVRTSILCKRWRHLWSSMSELNFNSYRLSRRMRMRTQLNFNNPKHDLLFKNRFTHFVTQFLSRRSHTSALTKFHLSLRGLRNRGIHDPTFIFRCIDYAVDHGVIDLDVHQLCAGPQRFPDAFYACHTLRQLALRSCGQFQLPAEFSLPNLTTLHVENSGFQTDDGMFSRGVDEPFAGFPNLEKLSMHNSQIYRLVIVAPKLKILEFTIDESRFSIYPEMKRISTPALASFRYQGFYPLECSEVELPAVLQEVYLDCSRKAGRRHRGYRPNRSVKCMRMLQQFGNAKVVTLGLDIIEILEMDGGVLGRSPSSSPIFRHMNCLKLTKRGDSSMNTVLGTVMDYLTWCDDHKSLVVEFAEDVYVVDHKIRRNMFDEDNGADEGQLEWLWAGLGD